MAALLITVFEIDLQNSYFGAHERIAFPKWGKTKAKSASPSKHQNKHEADFALTSPSPKCKTRIYFIHIYANITSPTHWVPVLVGIVTNYDSLCRLIDLPFSQKICAVRSYVKNCSKLLLEISMDFTSVN